MEKLLFIAIISFVVLGCHRAPKGPFFIYPKEIETKNTEYSINRDAVIFENKLIRISAEPMMPGEFLTGNTILDGLVAKNFIFIKMAIKNKSDKTLIYNPSHTSLLAGTTDFKKPLNYTDMYELVSMADEEGIPELQINSLKGIFYDLNTQLAPKEEIEKLLIFEPIDHEVKNKTAVLAINEVYIGTKVTSVSFPFSLKKPDKNR